MSGTITSLGLGSSIDLQGTIDQLRELDEEVITNKQEDISELEAQLSEFDVLQNKLLDMKGYALELSLEGTYFSREATLSNEQVASLVSSDGAVVQNTVITVTALASKSSWISAGMAETTSVVVDESSGESETFAYQVGETTVELEVAAGTTLEELVDLINSDEANPGVTAMLVNNGDEESPYQLVLQSDTTGEGNRISITTQLSFLSLTEKQGADGESLNARFSVDGIDYQRQSNTITDVIPSVQMTLQSTGDTTLTVSNDTQGIKDLLTNLVTAYNDLVAEIEANAGYDEDTEELGILVSTGFDDLTYTLRNLLSGFVSIGDGSVSSLFDLGISYESDGTMTLDEEVLDTMLEEHYDDIALFFAGDEENDVEGFATSISNFLRNAASEDDGVWALESSLAEQRIERLEEQIERETERLDKKYEVLTKQFIELDTYLSEMESMSDYLAETFAAITGSDD